MGGAFRKPMDDGINRAQRQEANQARAKRALRAMLGEYLPEPDEDDLSLELLQEAIQDFLTDSMHLNDLVGEPIKYDDGLRVAHDNYCEERDGTGD